MQYVFPFRAIVDNYTESLEWKTDISEAEDGTESAAKVRDVPRHSISLTAYADPKSCQLAYNALYSGMSSQWGIPLWHEAYQVPEINGGGLVLCGASVRDYVVGELVIVWTSNTSFQVLTVYDIAGDVLQFVETVQAATNAWVMPLKVGYISGQPQRSFNGFDELVSVVFDIDNAQLLTPAAPEQYKGYDFEQLENTLAAGRLESSFLNRADLADFDLGSVGRDFVWDHAKTVYPYSAIFDSVADLRTFREWLFRRSGAWRKFWMPTFELDLRFVDRIDTYTARFYDDGLTETQSIRDSVAFKHSDGVWYPRTITQIRNLSGGIVEITFSEGIATLDLSYCSWLSLRRLQADRVEISHLPNYVSRVSFNTLEVSPNGDGEGLLQTEPGLNFALESGDPLAIEEATSGEQAANSSIKISELTESSATDAAGGFLAVAIGTTNVKIPVADLLPEGGQRFSANVGVIGATSWTIINFLDDPLVTVDIIDNISGQHVPMSVAATASAITASGLAPIEATNQFKVIVRK